MKIKPTNVLILDDDKLVLRSLSRSLSRVLNVDNIVTINDPTLVEQYLSNSDVQYDLFITDYQMPSINGAQALKIVQVKSPTTIRVLMSGDIGSIHNDFNEVSANIFMPKPFSIDDINFLGYIYHKAKCFDVTDDHELKQGFVPYVPLPEKNTAETPNKQHSYLNTTSNFESYINVSKLENNDRTIILEASSDLLNKHIEFLDRFIDSVGWVQINKEIEFFFDWALKSFVFSRLHNVTEEQSIGIFCIIFSYWINKVVYLYLKAGFGKSFELSILNRYASIWGVDENLINERQKMIVESPSSDSAIICKTVLENINTNNEKTISDILISEHSNIDSLCEFLSTSKQTNSIEEGSI
ncbi:hypothetical protein JF50_16375 [Pseudoalteromonas luteoviolacea]|uniref:Response regulatory domain-containing protein n=1 Tax=Pseudoalteromonas luteoviolacea TaxID=43657 RepID=A0A0C1MGB8_9GAMM|nr:response regulator [Pseudoalteromonas luteoviolacea]KID55914.1 hypothetical protein JF50_16375 [Pseudoalteromonas luteoviolacea]